MARHYIVSKRQGRIDAILAPLELLWSSRPWTLGWFWVLAILVPVSIRQALVSDSLAQFFTTMLIMLLGIALAWWVILMWGVVFSIGFYAKIMMNQRDPANIQF